jgi:ubiquitin C-terminal hydrolase
MREVRRRLSELKKENEEIKTLLSISGKNHHEYELKVNLFSSTSI